MNYHPHIISVYGFSGYPMRYFSQKRGEKSEITVLMPLRNHKEKGPTYGIEALKIVYNIKNKSNSNVKFVSYGDYKGDIPNFIDFKGSISLEELVRLYQGSDIFIVPSLSEGFSLPGLEAMACGCAVIATMNGGSEQHIINHQNGILVNPANSQELAKVIIELINNDQLRMTLVKNGFETVKNYTYSKACDRFLEAIKCLETKNVS